MSEQPEPEAWESWSLTECLTYLKQATAQSNNTGDDAKIAAESKRIKDLSRNNFELEKQISAMDEQIAQSRRQGKEGHQESSTHRGDEKVWSPASHRTDYEELFYLLSSEHRYFVNLALLVNIKSSHSFVQTVVLDMFGNKFNPREERTLLTCFQGVLQKNFSGANMGTILRANTCTTQMLTAYARRGDGVQKLIEIFKPEVARIIGDKKMDLDMNPSSLHKKFISQYELKTGNEYKGSRVVDDQGALLVPEVKAMFAERTAALLEQVNLILERIFACVDSVPWGVRWICKQLKHLAMTTFPDASEAQVGSMIGGYIFLRYFNPVLVAPDSIALTNSKPTKKNRRNLILICKVLQNMSNGVMFGDKEQFMKVLNPFIAEKRPQLQAYFDTIVDVKDLGGDTEVDKYLENIGDNCLILNINQIATMHQLLNTNIDVVAPDPNDPIRAVLGRLGAAPACVKRSEDRQFSLQLTALSRDQRLNTVSGSEGSDELMLQAERRAKAMIQKILTAINFTQTDCPTFLQFISTEMKANDDESTNRHFVRLMEDITHMYESKANDAKSLEECASVFLRKTVREYCSRQNIASEVAARLQLVGKALESVAKFHEFLESRLRAYREVLDDVNLNNQLSSVPKAKLKKNTRNTIQVKVDEKLLSDMRVLQPEKCSQALQEMKRKGGFTIKYIFTQLDHKSVIDVQIKVKKGMFKVPLPHNPKMVLDVEELGTQDTDVIYLPNADDRQICLNRNLLLHFLYKRFMFIGARKTET